MAFKDTAGINGIINDKSGLTDVFLWGGGTFQQAIMGLASVVFRHDGSGHVASGKISWDKNGNPKVLGEFEGRIVSNANGNKIIIDPGSKSLDMLNSEGQVVSKQDFYLNNNFSSGRLRINLVDQTTGQSNCYVQIDGGCIAVYTADRHEFFRADAYQKKIWVDAELLPQSRAAANSKEMYMENETVKIKRA